MFFSHCHPSSVSVIYTLSLHDALPIFLDSFPLSLAYLITRVSSGALVQPASAATLVLGDMRCNSHASQFLDELPLVDRKSTRLNSSHRCISYAVFCLKKKSLICEGVSW